MPVGHFAEFHEYGLIDRFFWPSFNYIDVFYLLIISTKTKQMASTVHADEAEHSNETTLRVRAMQTEGCSGSSDSGVSDNKVWMCSVRSACQTFSHQQRKAENNYFSISLVPGSFERPASCSGAAADTLYRCFSASEA